MVIHPQHVFGVSSQKATLQLGFHKDGHRFGQPDRTETVGPSKWAFDGLSPDSFRSTHIFSLGPNEKKILPSCHLVVSVI